MPAYMKIAGVDGEVTEDGHKNWIYVDSISAPIHRRLPENAKTVVERNKGNTVLGDILLVRTTDTSSVKLAEKCSKGEQLPEVQIELCDSKNGVDESYLRYTLHNVIVTTYSIHASSDGAVKPTEEVSLNFTKVKWEYTAFDEKGKKKGQVVAEYDVTRHR